MTDVAIIKNDPWAESVYVDLPNGARLAMIRCEFCKRPRFTDYACDGCRAEAADAELRQLREAVVELEKLVRKMISHTEKDIAFRATLGKEGK